MFRAARFVGAQVKFTGPLLNRVHQSLNQRTLRPRPLRNLVDHRLAMLMQKLVRRKRRLPPLGYGKDVPQIGIRSKLGDRNFFPRSLVPIPSIELRHRSFHVVDREIGLSAPPRRLALPNLPPQPVQIKQLRHSAPAAIPLPPVRARSKPHRKRLGKIFIRMLLRIPSRQMPNIVARKRSGPVIVVIGPAEWPKDLFPLRLIVQLVSIGESVPRLMPQIHHDFPSILKIMSLFLQLRQSRMSQIKRNPNNRLARRASPLIGQITSRTKLSKPLSLQFAIKLFDKPLHRRPGKRKPQLTNRPAEELLVRGFRFRVYDVMHKRTLTNSLQPRGHTRGEAASLRLTVTESGAI